MRITDKMLEEAAERLTARDNVETRYRLASDKQALSPERRFTIIIKLMATAAMVGFAFGITLASCTVRAEEVQPVKLTGRVVVIDGDTIWRYPPRETTAEKIRIVGMDTPETFRPTCKAELAAGLEAKARLKELLNTRPILIRYGDDKGVMEDRFGRTLARVRVKQGDVADILIREGLALPYVPGHKAARNDHWCGVR